MKINDFNYDEYRKTGKFAFVIVLGNCDFIYRYYKKLSPIMIMKYLEATWEFNVDRRAFMYHLRNLNLFTQEIELAVKLK